MLIVCSSGWSRDFGVIGKVYPIIEEDLIVVLQKKMMEKQRNGEFAKEMKALKERSEQMMNRPYGVKLPRAKEYQVTSLSLVYRLKEDVVDADGKIIYKAGTEVNPLTIKQLSKELCFFDGDDLEQVKWVLKICGANPMNKLIMTNGGFIDLSHRYQRRFYFDQRGEIVERLGIKSLPAKVKQRGDHLYVEEFPID
ncbi:MAG: type-F conjugative transfer system protein TraW [Oligoflexia bacterium]|nr:type-F conjugative transfer system protein TraW [Oligoflexia bacterium]